MGELQKLKSSLAQLSDGRKKIDSLFLSYLQKFSQIEFWNWEVEYGGGKSYFLERLGSLDTVSPEVIFNLFQHIFQKKYSIFLTQMTA